MLLAVCQLSRYIIGYEDSVKTMVRFDPFIITVQRSFIVSQIVGCPVILL